jgi:aminoglycoside phosphotransferase family enzyme
VSRPGIEATVAFLRRRDVYAERPYKVDVVETHMSWIFLTERHVYKLKKPVRWDSLNFSTPELRRRSCEEEVRLNRRLTKDVYLGVIALTLGSDGKLKLDRGGEPVDWLVLMRRLPAARMLDELISRGTINRKDVQPAALKLARFYADANPVELTGPVYRARLEAGVRSDLHELSRPEFELDREGVRAIAQMQLDFLKRNAALVDARVQEGRLIEGHGDLRPEHICLDSEPSIIDCLEFSRDLRLLDPADELAYLGLECERLGRDAVGHWFLEAYTELTGDDPPSALMQFYRNYRSLRRAKIAIWHLKDPSVRDFGKWSERARRYLELSTAAPEQKDVSRFKQLNE